MTAPVLDWRHHRIGPPAPCRYCQRSAYCRDEQGRAAHKVCAEREAALCHTDPAGGLPE
jgi:hypothetical protein